ncbi:MAG: hypothetical protein NC114_12120, partial [Ruminococcus flavefaciens]|nr:hypothetical protein [Ruminococcus flavefaciens]
MKTKLLSLILATTAIMSQAENKLLEKFDTPLGTAPFSEITVNDYAEAIDKGIERANQEIDAICNNRAFPDFENTIVALDRVGGDLNRTLGLFYNLLEADGNEEMMKLSLEVSPKLSASST